MRNVLYIEGVFDGNWSDATSRVLTKGRIESAADVLVVSDWTVLNIAFLHVTWSPGDGFSLVLNDTPIADLYPQLGSVFKRLAAAGKTLVLTIGGGLNADDFTAIGNDVEGFVSTLQADLPWSLTGIDLDLEGDYETAGPTVAALANAAAAAGLVVTATDSISNIASWVGDNPAILQKTKTSNGNNVSWFNAQAYGQSSNGFTETYASAVTTVNDASADTGITSGSAFLIPTFALEWCDRLTACEETLTELRSVYSDFGGAAFWRYIDMAIYSEGYWIALTS